MYIGLDDLVRITDGHIDLEAELTIGGELTDQNAVGTSTVNTCSRRQDGPGVVHEAQHVTIGGECIEVDRTTKVVSQRRQCTGDVAIVPSKARVHATGGQVTVGVSGTQYTHLSGVGAATGRTSCDTRGTDRDIGIEQGTFVHTTGLHGYFRTEVVVVPERGGGLDDDGIGANAATGRGLRAGEDVQETVVGSHVHVDTVDLHAGHQRKSAAAEVIVVGLSIGSGHRVVFLHDDAFETLCAGSKSTNEGDTCQQGSEEISSHVLCVLG